MKHILLVEPDVLLATTYNKAFIHSGYEVSHVTTGQAAIDAADSMSPDLIVLELQLPAHNGLEFLYEFRSYPEWQIVPVITNTNIPFQQLGSAWSVVHDQLGIRAWHYKPQTTLQILLRSVREQLLPPQESG
ncbi:MAG TPA: response regulator [Candidatus Saccharimonadales bacterium]|nr:response regulator [Candidatus Saccharimonadales bacterium]